MCFALKFTLLKLDLSSDLNFKAWDYGITTAADFTIELIITQQHYEKYLEAENKECSFKKELIKQLQEQVSQQKGNMQVKIINVFFAFNNRIVINKLINRGDGFSNGKFEKLLKAED